MGKSIKATTTTSWEDVYRIVRRIPPGRVMNYGAIAQALHRPMSARGVGWALNRCPEDVPWHRVVNAAGGISTEPIHPLTPGLQRKLLESEGVRFGANERCDLSIYSWTPARRGHKKK